MKPINKRFIFICLFLIIFLIIANKYSVDIHCFLRWLFEGGLFKQIVLGYTFVSILAYSLTVPESSTSNLPIFKIQMPLV